MRVMDVVSTYTTLNRSERKSQAQRAELSDSRMLSACIDLVNTQGTDKTTLKAVGELAGYSRGLAGARFKSKTGLFCFVIKRVADQWREEMEKRIQGKTGYDAVCAAIDAHRQVCLKAPKPFRAFYILWFESIGHDSDISRVIVNIHERRLSDVTRWIESAIEAGELGNNIDAQSVARYLLTSMFGIVYQWLINPGLEQEISRLHEQLKETMKNLLPTA